MTRLALTAFTLSLALTSPALAERGRLVAPPVAEVDHVDAARRPSAVSTIKSLLGERRTREPDAATDGKRSERHKLFGATGGRQRELPQHRMIGTDIRVRSSDILSPRRADDRLGLGYNPATPFGPLIQRGLGGRLWW